MATIKEIKTALGRINDDTTLTDEHRMRLMAMLSTNDAEARRDAEIDKLTTEATKFLQAQDKHQWIMEFQSDPKEALTHGTAGATAALAHWFGADAPRFFAQNLPADSTKERTMATWIAHAKAAPEASQRAKSAANALATHWQPWTGDGSTTDAARVQRLLAATATVAISAPVDLAQAWKQLVATRPCGPMLLELIDRRAATILEADGMAMADKRAVAAVDAIAAIRAHLMLVAAQIDVARMAADEWTTTTQRADESVEQFIARVKVLWARAGHQGQPTTADVIDKVRPEVSRKIGPALLEQVARSHAHEPIRKKAEEIRTRTDNGDIVFNAAWARAGANMPQDLLVAILARAEKEARNERPQKTTSVVEINAVARAAANPVDNRTSTHPKQPKGPNDNKPTTTAAADKTAAATAAAANDKTKKEETTVNNPSIICLGCGNTGHPVKLCPSTNDTAKKLILSGLRKK